MCPRVSLHYEMRCVAANLLGSELAEYLLYDITAPEAIPDASQGKLFQRRNVVLQRWIRILSGRKEKLETLSASL